MGFAERLKEKRLECGYTQEELADKLNLKKSSISGYELGTSSPKEEVLIKMFTVLNTDANYLFQDHYVKSNNELSILEKNMIENYRKLDDFGKEAVNSILTIELKRCESKENKYIVYRAARSKDHKKPQITTIDEKTLQRLKDAPVTDDEL